LTWALRAPGFPTVIVQGKGLRRAHFGVTPYAQVEAALLEVAGVPARRGAPTMVQVLAQYGGGTSREFAEVLEVTPGEAEQMLRAAGASRAEDGLWRVVS
jgi:hypothetical protein